MKQTINLISRIFAVTTLALGLAACVGVKGGSEHVQSVTNETLANGKVTRVGWRQPGGGTECTEITRVSYNWATLKTKGTYADWKGPYDYFKGKAIDYANDNKLSPDYIALVTPDTVTVGALDASPNAKANAIYYKCKVAPALDDKIL